MDTLPNSQERPRRRWSLEEYESFVDLGIISPDERLELIGGEVVEQVSPQKTAHATAICLVDDQLRTAFARGYVIRIQLPLRLLPDSEPEPDLAVVTGRARDYRSRHPETAHLVVEVSDATLRDDRRAKAGMYARAGIAEYWIVNVQDSLLEVHREPAATADEPFGHHYRSVQRLEASQTVQPLGSMTVITVEDLLP